LTTQPGAFGNSSHTLSLQGCVQSQQA
jgi:hypothetical protein